MPRDLFGDVSDPSVRVGSRKWYTVPLSLFVHTVVLLLVVVIPLVATAVLPDPRSTLPNFVPLVEPILPPPPPMRRAPDTAQPRANPNAAPLTSPDTITLEPDQLGGFENEVDGGLDLLTVGSLDGVGVPEPPPPPPAKKPQEPVRPGGLIRPPERIDYVAPVYSVIAREARIEGVVIIEATIGIDGRVMNARILRSVTLLDESALAAVRQWTYRPTTLNGVPVPVIMTVTVNFTLR